MVELLFLTLISLSIFSKLWQWCRDNKRKSVSSFLGLPMQQADKFNGWLIKITVMPCEQLQVNVALFQVY